MKKVWAKIWGWDLGYQIPSLQGAIKKLAIVLDVVTVYEETVFSTTVIHEIESVKPLSSGQVEIQREWFPFPDDP